MGIPNIKSLVPVTLDLVSPQYNRWRGLFLNTLEHYALADHVLCDEDYSDDVPWRRLDCTVLSWLYGTIAPELHEVVTNQDRGPPTARRVWQGSKQQFIGNREHRAIILDAEFRTLVLGDLTVIDYRRRLKAIADQLADLGEPVRNRTLVLNMLRGLNDRFSHLVDLIQRQRPFPRYPDVLSDLYLVEMTMKSKPSASAQAFATTTPRPPTTAPPQAVPSNYNTSGGKKNRRNAKKPGGDGGGSASGSQGAP